MRHALILKKKLDFARFTHLLIMYTAAILFFLWSNLPHAWWILAMTLAISSSIEPGLMFGNVIQRSKGSFLSLLLLPLIIYAFQLNYRLIPVFFIITAIGFNVASLNFRRYDITVFFNTMLIILLLAQTTFFTTYEGPLEAVINRGLSTIIAVMIIVFGDYFLFKSYGYSQKLYLFHQMLIHDLFLNMVNQITSAPNHRENIFLLRNRLRTQTNETFTLILASGENLKLDLKVSNKIKQQVDDFQGIIWELRRKIFALFFSELTLKSTTRSDAYLEQCHHLLNQLKKNFIIIDEKQT